MFSGLNANTETPNTRSVPQLARRLRDSFQDPAEFPNRRIRTLCALADFKVCTVPFAVRAKVENVHACPERGDHRLEIRF